MPFREVIGNFWKFYGFFRFLWYFIRQLSKEWIFQLFTFPPSNPKLKINVSFEFSELSHEDKREYANRKRNPMPYPDSRVYNANRTWAKASTLKIRNVFVRKAHMLSVPELFTDNCFAFFENSFLVTEQLRLGWHWFCSSRPFAISSTIKIKCQPKV